MSLCVVHQASLCERPCGSISGSRRERPCGSRRGQPCGSRRARNTSVILGWCCQVPHVAHVEMPKPQGKCRSHKVNAEANEKPDRREGDATESIQTDELVVATLCLLCSCDYCRLTGVDSSAIVRAVLAGIIVARVGHTLGERHAPRSRLRGRRVLLLRRHGACPKTSGRRGCGLATCHLRAARDYSAPLDTPPTRAQHIGQVVFSVRRWQVILQSFESDPSLHTSRMTQHTPPLCTLKFRSSRSSTLLSPN